MASKLSVWIVAVCWGMVSGCAAVVVATGAGAGAYTYVNGELARAYPAAYIRTMEACTQILNDLKMPIKEQTSDHCCSSTSASRRGSCCSSLP